MKKLIIYLVLFCTGGMVYAQSCTGRFPNLVSDICYDCMFPITLGGAALSFGVASQDYDSGANAGPICACANSLSIGVPTSFWAPELMVDTTNSPGCMPLLGGISISPPINSSETGGDKQTNKSISGKSKISFMHINQYLNPVMTTLGVIPDSPCLDHRGFDVPYVSWADPTWGSDEISMILTPYAIPFANIASIASEAPDAIAASIGFPFATLFWTAGAWGPMYPTTGNVASPHSPELVSHLLMARLFAKLHAVGTQQSTAGLAALQSCGALGVPQFIMDKRQYKTNRLFPFPDNMCTPISRPLVLQEKGAAMTPFGKDYGYFIFQKVDCCAGVIGASGAGG